MNFNLTNNKNLILTGGAGLLGSEFGIFLAEQGYNVFIFDKNVNKILLLKKKLEKLKIKNVFIFKVDITKYHLLKKLYKKIITRYGDIKVLINNASIDWIPKKNKEIKIELNSKNIISEFNVSICGSLNCIQLFLEMNKKLDKCNILNIGSDLSVIAPDQRLYKHLNFIKPISYSIIKHGIVGMTKYLSALLAEKNIRVNCLSPASIENNQNQLFKKKIKKLIPLKRLSKKNEFNKLLLFLISEDSSYITGQNIIADGGRSII